MNNNRDIALLYGRYGVRVFPCQEGTSRGGRAKAPYFKGGWHNASHDPQRLAL